MSIFFLFYASSPTARLSGNIVHPKAFGLASETPPYNSPTKQVAVKVEYCTKRRMKSLFGLRCLATCLPLQSYLTDLMDMCRGRRGWVQMGSGLEMWYLHAVTLLSCI